METELDTLRIRLQQEQEHLDWFIRSGQRMNASGVDTSEVYIASVRHRIASLQQQIARHSKSPKA